MDENVEQGLFTGGPVGGVVVFGWKHLYNLATFCGYDNYLAGSPVLNLFVKRLSYYYLVVTSQCNYRRILSDIFVYIEAVALSYPGVRCWIFEIWISNASQVNQDIYYLTI